MKEYIELKAAVDLAMQYCPDDDGACSKADRDIRELLDELEALPAADVISKADMITLLEETEIEVLKGINRYSTPWIMINSIFGIIKCMVNMIGEKTDG